MILIKQVIFRRVNRLQDLIRSDRIHYDSACKLQHDRLGVLAALYYANKRLTCEMLCQAYFR